MAHADTFVGVLQGGVGRVSFAGDKGDRSTDRGVRQEAGGGGEKESGRDL